METSRAPAYDAKKVEPGTCISVRINDSEAKVENDGDFSVRHGELAFASWGSG